VAEWLMAADCKSALFGVRGFESLPVLMIKFMNLILVIKDQMPLTRFIRNLRKGHLLGIVSKRSHFRGDGVPKQIYNTKNTAVKSAKKMSEKNGVYFSNYKCLWCDGYHIGKNRENKTLNTGNA
jgi:hypothetical protein